jgi:hypothetical protein
MLDTEIDRGYVSRMNPELPSQGVCKCVGFVMTADEGNEEGQTFFEDWVFAAERAGCAYEAGNTNHNETLRSFTYNSERISHGRGVILRLASCACVPHLGDAMLEQLVAVVIELSNMYNRVRVFLRDEPVDEP